MRQMTYLFVIGFIYLIYKHHIRKTTYYEFAIPLASICVALISSVSIGLAIILFFPILLIIYIIGKKQYSNQYIIYINSQFNSLIE